MIEITSKDETVRYRHNLLQLRLDEQPELKQLMEDIVLANKDADRFEFLRVYEKQITDAVKQTRELIESMTVYNHLQKSSCAEDGTELPFSHWRCAIKVVQTSYFSLRKHLSGSGPTPYDALADAVLHAGLKQLCF